MLSRFVPTMLIIVILGMILAGCGAATEQPPVQQPVNEATAPTPALNPVEEAAPTSEPPAPPTDTPAPVVVAEEPAAPAATEEPAPAAEEASAGPRTFQVVTEQSEASYQVQEEFFNRQVNIFNPIGRTNAIEGQFQLNISDNQVQLAGNQFTVDLRTLTSDEARRDQRIREQWLESNTYPLAEFRATAIEDFPTNAVEGQDVSFKLVGDLTIREITRPQTFEVTARLEDNTFSGTATTNLLMRDYGFEPPSILGMLQVTDGVTVTVKFVAQEVQGGS